MSDTASEKLARATARQALDIGADSLLAGVAQAVHHYHHQSFEEVSRTVLCSRQLDSEDEQAFVEGSRTLYVSVQKELQSRLQQLEGLASTGPLHIPAGLTVPQSSEQEVDGAGGHSERELDDLLVEKRRQIWTVQAETQQLLSQAAELEQELRDCGDLEQLTHVASSALGKENMATDARAVVSRALQLQELLSKAGSLQQADAADNRDINKDVTMQAEKAIMKHKAVVNGASTQVMRSLRENLAAPATPVGCGP